MAGRESRKSWKFIEPVGYWTSFWDSSCIMKLVYTLYEESDKIKYALYLGRHLDKIKIKKIST